VGLGGVLALVFSTVTLLPVTPAGATNAPIVVTTTADVIDPTDGLLSLREAIDLANASAGDDTILMADGATYDLTRCGSDNDTAPSNATGDLDTSGSDPLTIAAVAGAVTPPTIHQTCAQRVIFARGPLVLQHVDVAGGHAVQGGAIRSDGPLTLDHVEQSGAASSDAAVYASGRPVKIDDSVIRDNAATGIEQNGGATTAIFEIVRSSIRDNLPTTSNARAAGVDAEWSTVTIDHSEVVGNGGTGSTSPTNVGGVFSLDATVRSSVIARNHGARVGGIGYGFHLIDSQVTDNVAGGASQMGLGGGGGGLFTLERSVVARNHSSFIGGRLLGNGTIHDSTIADNEAFNPVGNVPGVAGGIAVATDPTHSTLVIENSTITRNRGAVAGGVAVYDDWDPQNPSTTPATVVIKTSTIAGNLVTPFVAGQLPPLATQPEAAELAYARWNGEPASNFAGSLSATASVFGSGDASATACSLAAASPVVSGGHDFSSDGSCLGGGPGDVAAGGDPGLSPSADHGGPTPTMMPTVGSPLLDLVPAAFSTCAGQHDQRGVARPVGTGCDIGAVEADAPMFPTEGEFTPIVPHRLMDTRSDPAYHVGTQYRFGPNGTQDLVVAGGSSPVPADATAVVVNVTAVAPTDASDVDVWPTGRAQPNASNLNFTPGETVPNLVKVKVGANGKISLFNRNGSVDVIVDVVGYYRTDPTASRFTPIIPNRLVDTRADPAYHIGAQTRLGDQHDPRTLTVAGTGGVPLNATAIIANVTVVSPDAASHLDVWPSGTPHPNASNLNYAPAQTVANLVVVKVSADGKIDLVNANGSVDVIVDVVGYFTVDATAAGFLATVPNRLIDTRADPADHVGTQSRFGGSSDPRTIVVTGGVVPTDARAIVANITVVTPDAFSHLDVWPAGTVRPNVSNLNDTPGQTVSNLVTVKIGANGAIDVENRNGSVDVVIDIVGYYR
jgi:hypothetical protein